MNNDAPAAIAIDLVSDTATRPCANGVFGADETLRAVAGAARGHGLLLHMDGARLMNAAVATGIAAQSYAELFDSVWLDLSKGLGCPVGGVLAGSSAFIQEADRWKHRFGGASTWPAADGSGGAARGAGPVLGRLSQQVSGVFLLPLAVPSSLRSTRYMQNTRHTHLQKGEGK
jgi:hypothetical protein